MPRAPRFILVESCPGPPGSCAHACANSETALKLPTLEEASGLCFIFFVCFQITEQAADAAGRRRLLHTSQTAAAADAAGDSPHQPLVAAGLHLAQKIILLPALGSGESGSTWLRGTCLSHFALSLWATNGDNGKWPPASSGPQCHQHPFLSTLWSTSLCSVQNTTKSEGHKNELCTVLHSASPSSSASGTSGCDLVWKRALCRVTK